MNVKLAGVKKRQVQVSPMELKRMMLASEALLDVTEEILERSGAYAKEFLQGLQASMKQYRSGKAMRINSVRELL